MGNTLSYLLEKMLMGDCFLMNQYRVRPPIGTTPNHPIWSVDREAFVRTDSLSVGERLQTLNGIARITNITARGPPEPVYNLEVQVKHTYFIADSGVLVHNGANCDLSSIGTQNAATQWETKTGRAYDRRFRRLWRQFEGEEIGDNFKSLTLIEGLPKEFNQT
ncbi:Hint domain-containing protein [Gimesia sp.]|uniref:Hint domain-containing protein n=1 Tax=Gimesia sp. TaxID=2024833 RepID=UPI003A8DC439